MPPMMRWLIALALGAVVAGMTRPVTAQQGSPPTPPTQDAKSPATTASPETLAELKKIIALASSGGYQAAEAPARELLASVEKSIGPESIDAAKVLDILTENMMLAGKARDPEVRALIDRSIAIHTRLLGPNNLETQYSVRNLATLLHKTGDYAGARPLFERVLDIQQKGLGPNDAQIGFTSVNFGGLLKDMGDYAAARASLARAIQIYEGLKRDGAVAIAAGNMVGVLAGLRDYAGAKWYAERTYEIRLRIDGPDHLNTAIAQANLAGTLALMIEHAAAKPLFESALAVMVKRLGENHAAVADIVHNLAECLKTLGDNAGAREYYARATAIYEKTMGPDHPGFGEHLLGIALFLGQMGDIAGAVDLALRAERISRNHTQLTVPGLPERQALAVAAARISSMDLLLTLATKRPVETEASRADVWDSLIRGRALILDEMGARQHVAAARDNADIAERVRALTLARQRLATLFVRASSYTPEQYRTLVDQARREKERAEGALAEKSAPFRADVGRSRIGLKDVVAALPANSALIAFVRSGQIELGEERTPGKPPRTFFSYVALVLRSDGAATLTPVSLGAALDIDRAVSRWREEMAQEAQAPGRASQRMEASYRVAATELRQKVWDPIASQLQGLKRVFIVPDGALHLVSFASLPVDQTGYLVEKGPIIHYLSAERDLVSLATEPPNTGLLAVGAPAFDDAVRSSAVTPGAPVFRGNRSACQSFESMQFGPLAESAGEAQAITALWEKTHGKPISHLNGPEATEAAFKQEAPGKRVLHLATHGFFLGGRCTSALETRGQPGASKAVTGENPLLLSGLVLAGANNRGSAGAQEEDGILTAEEIAALDLNGVEWAVLSACDTGLGEVKAGEGVFGLRRAFQVAGVRTIVMSLWQIQDQAARTWMTALYDGRFAKKLDTASAAHQASMKVLTQRRARKQSTHPFYWAGFVAAGDWR